MAHDHERARLLTLAEVEAMSASEVLTWMDATDAEREDALNCPKCMRHWRESLKCCTDEFAEQVLVAFEAAREEELR